jgi:hypothetical protein
MLPCREPAVTATFDGKHDEDGKSEQAPEGCCAVAAFVSPRVTNGAENAKQTAPRILMTTGCRLGTNGWTDRRSAAFACSHRSLGRTS